MDNAICHVLRPGTEIAPDEARFRMKAPQPAIRVTGASNVIYLNEQKDTGATSAKNCTYSPQKNPIAK